MFIAPKSHVAKRCVTIYDRKQLKNNFILWVVVEHESSVRTPWMLSWANMLGLILFPLTAKKFLPDCDHLRLWSPQATQLSFIVYFINECLVKRLSVSTFPPYTYGEKNSFEKGVWFNRELLALQGIALTFRPWLVEHWHLRAVKRHKSPNQGSH